MAGKGPLRMVLLGGTGAPIPIFKALGDKLNIPVVVTIFTDSELKNPPLLGFVPVNTVVRTPLFLNREPTLETSIACEDLIFTTAHSKLANNEGPFTSIASSLISALVRLIFKIPSLRK